MISTRDLSALPTIQALRKVTQSLAMLDAIIQREWDYRYYSFNSKWADYGEMASMRNGQGDEWFCVFGPPGVFLKGFDHESPMSPWTQDTQEVWPGVLDSIPEAFNSCVKEPAFSIQDTTFCVWRTNEDAHWKKGVVSYPGGEDPDGSGGLLFILDGNPNTYKEWAEDYFEKSISLPAIQQIYAHTALTPEIVCALNPSIEFASILGDAEEIAYPFV